MNKLKKRLIHWKNAVFFFRGIMEKTDSSDGVFHLFHMIWKDVEWMWMEMLRTVNVSNRINIIF